ncbi:MAG: CDP-abequose synthase [Ferruginibacter sp.]|nr:CDP-abequose synthase [Ferruginibacter sp.]
MRKIIVHGASSFLGKNFLRKMSVQKIPADIFARRKSSMTEFESNPLFNIYRYEKSISEISHVNQTPGSTTFVDFSWYGVFGTERNIPEQITVNIPLVIDSVKTAHSFKCNHWIGFGSQAEYGNLDKRISESDPGVPTTLYGKSKLICSQISADLCKSYGMDHSWLRLFSVYGPNDTHEWLIQYLIKQMLLNKEINVTKGEQLWDYLYVDDISEMLLKLIKSRGVGIANLGTGNGISVRMIIEKIKNIIQSESKINFGALPYRSDQVMLMEADITKLSTHLKWKPEISLDEGLRKTIEFIRTTSN